MNLNLTVGRLLDAWKSYPVARRELRAMPKGPPIFVTGTHRSGTTWVASMLAEAGLWYVHEPFNPNKKIWKESFTYVSPQERQPKVDRYFEGLLNGRYRLTANMPHTDHPLMPLRLFRPPIRRVMVKDPLACLLTGYLNRNFDLNTLVLFRHPAGFVSSILRLEWPAGGFLEDFLSRHSLMQDHLFPYESLMNEHSERDDAAAAAVLHGVLNTVQWNQIQQDESIQHFLFEQLCQDPLNSFQKIFSDFNLPYSDQTRHRHAELCLQGSVEPGDYHTHAVARNSSAMANSWHRQLTRQQVAEVRTIWEQFEIPFYHSEDDWKIESPCNAEVEA